MTVAVTYDNGTIFQHFGHTEQFMLYRVADGRIAEKTLLSSGGTGHGALAGLLRTAGVDALICGGIGGGAQTALAQAGIRLYGGASGSADDAVAALLDGTLSYNPAVTCDHHGEHDHHGGDHGCGGSSCHAKPN